MQPNFDRKEVMLQYGISKQCLSDILKQKDAVAVLHKVDVTHGYGKEYDEAEDDHEPEPDQKADETDLPELMKCMKTFRTYCRKVPVLMPLNSFEKWKTIV